MKYISRNIESRLIRYVKSFSVVALTGPRQSGKSTTLKHLFSNYQYISLDDITVVNRIQDDLNLFMDTLPSKVIFDEIQYMPEIIRNIKVQIDRERQKKGSFILTGSSQFTLMKGLAETLAGRVGILNLLPFDILEFPPVETKSSLKDFSNRCLCSSYPEPTLMKRNFDIEGWFSSYISTYIEKDVKMLYDIGNLREFQRFIYLLSTRISGLLNLSEISKELGVSIKTINRWISILEAGFIIFLVQPYHRNLGKRISKHPKLYFWDCGFSAYMTNIRTMGQLLKSPFSSHLFENYCIQEIIKFFSHTQGKKSNIFFYRTNYGLEVDLIIEHDFYTVSIIEIKFTKTPNRGMVKNIELLKKSLKDIKVKNSYLICLIDKEEIISEDIIATNLSNLLQKWAKN